MRGFSVGLLLASVAAGEAPARAQDDARIAELEAKLEAQDARIRTLEQQLTQALDQKPPVPAAATVQPSFGPPKAPEFPTVRLSGRLQVDALVVNAPGEEATGTQIRRAQLGAAGQITPELRFQATAEFAGSRVALEDTLVGYRVSPATEILAGYFKPPITSDEMTSDLFTLFLERSAYSTTFGPGRRVGLGFIHSGRSWGLRGGVFGERDDSLLDVDRREGWLVAGRAHADLLPGEPALHAAVSGYFSRTGSEEQVALTQRPETNRAPLVLDTGRFAAEHGSFFGGELGYGSGPLTVQTEGGFIRYGGGPADPLFWGLSAQVAWRFTGEERAYDPRAGIFGRVKPRRGFGALEGGLRFTHVDLQNEGIMGGRLTTYGAVLNWYPFERLRIAGNIIHAITEGRGSASDESTLITLRGGIDW